MSLSDLRALGPAWIVPVEVARHIATPGSLAELLKAEARGAEFRPHATVCIRAGRFVAEVGFLHPLGPEKDASVVLMLSAAPQENA